MGESHHTHLTHLPDSRRRGDTVFPPLSRIFCSAQQISTEMLLELKNSETSSGCHQCDCSLAVGVRTFCCWNYWPWVLSVRRLKLIISITCNQFTPICHPFTCSPMYSFAVPGSSQHVISSVPISVSFLLKKCQ
jgi:hypothetical protein